MTGVIFDLDGTLIDSMGIWEEADRTLLSQFGCVPDEEYNKKIVTLNFTEGVEFIRQKFQIPFPVEKMKQELFQIVYEKYAFEIDLKEGVKDYLEQLRQEGVCLAMVTSSIPEMCRVVLKRHGIDFYFQEIVFAEEMGKGKEGPECYLEAARRMQIEPKDCIVFEDVPHAVLGAKKAGMTVIGVFDFYSRKQETWMQQNCHKYIRSFLELKGKDTANLIKF